MLVGLLLFHVPGFGLALRLWLVGVVGLLAWALAAPALAAWPVPGDPRRRPHWPWRRAERPPPVRSLEELEHAIEFSQTTAFDVHYRLRPHLVQVAAHRLAERGVSLEGQPELARRLLGAEAWELVRPDRRPPERRHARGIALGQLREVVERLDAL